MAKKVSGRALIENEAEQLAVPIAEKHGVWIYDVEYVKNITFRGDLRIVLRTIRQVFAREDIAVDTDTAETYLDEERGVPHDQGDRS